MSPLYWRLRSALDDLRWRLRRRGRRRARPGGIGAWPLTEVVRGGADAVRYTAQKAFDRVRQVRMRPMATTACVALLAALAYGSTRLGDSSESEPMPAAGVSSLPALPPLTSEFAGEPLSVHLDAMRGSQDQWDDLLTSSVLRDPEFARAVHWWVGYWTGPATEWFPGFLNRMAWLGSDVDSALARHGLPPALRYLPLIESGYDPRVTSRAAAVGLWQLMPVTARGLGLEVTPLLDERRHAERSTEAALTYLASLRERFGSWHWALAAYNSGPTRARTVLRRHANGAEPTDSLFWALREHFPRETREFVPKLYGAMWVASQPGEYGYEVAEPEPDRFELVRVPHQTTLDVVALAAGAPHDEILRLNPEYLRGVTPPDRTVTLRVPEGRARTFRRIYPRIRPEDRVTFVEHVVRSGETLGEIADRYGLRIAEIEAANPRLQPRTLAIGLRLVVPVSPVLQDQQTP